MEIAFSKFWNEKDHGYTEGQVTDPHGHILMIDSITYSNHNNLKIFQRKYRRWLKKRRKIGSLKNLLKREIYGR